MFQNQCRPPGSESLPKGLVMATSNLEMRPLWGAPEVMAFETMADIFTADGQIT